MINVKRSICRVSRFNVSPFPLLKPYQPTIDELREAWRRSGLWRSGHTFLQDTAVPAIALALRNAVIAQHKKQALPMQGSLELES